MVDIPSWLQWVGAFAGILAVLIIVFKPSLLKGPKGDTGPPGMDGLCCHCRSEWQLAESLFDPMTRVQDDLDDLLDTTVNNDD